MLEDHLIPRYNFLLPFVFSREHQQDTSINRRDKNFFT